MITYIETSALIKLLIEENGSDAAAATWDGADARFTSRIAQVEARAALASARRSGRLSASALGRAKRALDERFSEMNIVEVTSLLARHAGDLAKEHSLRGYDAVHLASALVVDEAIVLTTWDRDLIGSARRLGMSVATR